MSWLWEERRRIFCETIGARNTRNIGKSSTKSSKMVENRTENVVVKNENRTGQAGKRRTPARFKGLTRLTSLARHEWQQQQAVWSVRARAQTGRSAVTRRWNEELAARAAAAEQVDFSGAAAAKVFGCWRFARMTGSDSWKKEKSCAREAKKVVKWEVAWEIFFWKMRRKVRKEGGVFRPIFPQIFHFLSLAGSESHFLITGPRFSSLNFSFYGLWIIEVFDDCKKMYQVWGTNKKLWKSPVVNGCKSILSWEK